MNYEVSKGMIWKWQSSCTNGIFCNLREMGVEIKVYVKIQGEFPFVIWASLTLGNEPHVFRSTLRCFSKPLYFSTNYSHWNPSFALRSIMHLGAVLPITCKAWLLYSPPTLTSVGHQWTVSTNIGCNQWLSLLELALKVVLAGRNRLLVALINKCGGLLMKLHAAYTFSSWK